jgi:serine/threonine protein kinase
VSLQQPTRQREIARPIMAQLEIDGSTQETEAAFQELEIGESRPSLTEDALLVENLRDGTAGKKEQAAHTLADRARYSPNRFAIVRAGGIRPLVALMRNGENGGKNQAVRALMNLAQHDDIRKAIDKADGIAPLLALDAIAHPTAAKALTNLSSTQVGRKLVAKARASGEEQAATGRMINLGFRNVPVLTGRYRSDFDEGEVLGRGGFGTVVKATNKLDEEDYAMKKIRASSDKTWRPDLTKILREVKSLASLDHLNIVGYCNAWLEAGTSNAGLVDQSSGALLTSAVPSPLSTTGAWTTQDEEAVAEPFTETLKSFDMCASDMPSVAAREPIVQQQKKEPVNYDLVLYIQMQYCPQTLRDFIKAGNNVDESLKIFAQIARGLAHVHGQGLVHRDLKPANIFLIDGDAKIGDFGLSRLVGQDDVEEHNEEGGDPDEGITRGVGTKLYAAPEQFNSDNYDAKKADVYSLGAVLYELLRPNCTKMERAKLAEASCDERRALLRTDLPNVDKNVAEVVVAALAHNPRERPAAAKVASIVERALEADVVRQMNKDGAPSPDRTVILSPTGVRVYSNKGEFLEERPAGRSSEP